MLAETEMLREIKTPNNYLDSSIENITNRDMALSWMGGSTVFEIKMDVFNPINRFIIKKENMEKIKKSIENSKKDWNDCLKKSDGNYEKALKMYKDY